MDFGKTSFCLFFFYMFAYFLEIVILNDYKFLNEMNG